MTDSVRTFAAKALGITASCLALTYFVSGQSNNDALDKVLHRMDETAATFQTAQADFVWTPYNGVVNEAQAPDKGKIYFRRSGKETQMAADLVPRDAQQIIFLGDKLQVYRPKMAQVDVYDTSAHREEIETFLVLGFGSSGEDLQKTFTVTYTGEEKIGAVQAAKLQLVPVAQNVKDRFPEIDLWIDPDLGVSLRQKLMQKDGDYRLAEYSNIKLNRKLPNNVFKLKTSGETKTVTH